MCSPTQAGTGAGTFRLAAQNQWPSGLCMCIPCPSAATGTVLQSRSFIFPTPSIMVSPSTRGLLFPATTLIMLAREEKALWNDAVREHAPALRGHLGNARGRGQVLGSHSDWRRDMAFGGRAWHANHPVLGQACTIRNFPTGYSSRSKNHIHNFQTYKLISTHM